MKQRSDKNYGDSWKTPDKFYNKLNEKWNFDFDPCPLDHDLSKWNGLTINWGKRNFVNPPYSQKLKEAFIKKGVEEMKKGNSSVFLIPASTSTNIFHDKIMPLATEISFVRGRIPFIGVNTKGQIVNSENPTNETIFYRSGLAWYDPELYENPEIKEIPLHVKNSGMHDSMLVVFEPNKIGSTMITNFEWK